MICKFCGSDYDEKMFEICPFCLMAHEEDGTQGTHYVLPEKDSKLNAKEYSVSNQPTSGMNFGDQENCKSESKELSQDCSEGISSKQSGNIEKVKLPAIKLTDVDGLSARAKNILKRNRLTSFKELFDYLKTHRFSDLYGVGAETEEEMANLISRLLCGEFNNEIMSEDILDISTIRTGSPIVNISNISKEKNIYSILEEELIEARGSREYDIFLRRANGETLQGIADNPPGVNADGITRERVRQIETRFHRRIRRYLYSIIEKVVNEKGYVTEQALIDMFGDEEFGTIMSYSLKMDDRFEYLDFADCFVKRAKGQKEETRVLNLITDFIGDGLNLYDHIEFIEELLARNNVPYMGLGELISLLEKSGYRVYGEYVTKGKVSYGLLCKMLVNEHFESGIKLNQDDTTKCEDLERLRELAYKKFGDIGIPKSDRAFSARLANYMVFCDRGKVIPEDKIVIDLSLLNDIRKYIDNLNVEKIYYSEIYAHFEGVLNLTSNVNNYYFLHGVLMLYFPDRYVYSRDYLIRKNYKGASENNADRIRKYIKEEGRVITGSELRAKFPGFSNIMIDLMFTEDQRLLQWDYNLYSSTDLVKISEHEKWAFRDLLIKILHDNGGFASETILFDALSQYEPDFLEKNKMTQPISAFYYFSKLYKDIADFRHPNIGEKGKLDNLTIKDISLYLLGNNGIIRYSDYIKIVERMKWSSVSASAAFGKIEASYLRISEDEYVIEADFNIPADSISDIRNCLKAMMSNRYLPLGSIYDYNDFPELRYEWNSFLIESIVKKYLPEYKIIEQENRDRRYQKGILLDANSSITSYSELVATIFKEAGYSEMPEGQFLAFLVVHGLARLVVPHELSCSPYFSLEKGVYRLKYERV